MLVLFFVFFVFFFNDTATTEIYTLSLHDALPILRPRAGVGIELVARRVPRIACMMAHDLLQSDRKSTRLNSSHSSISYAVFCLKKKKKKELILTKVKQIIPTNNYNTY